jgi:hypothetical protein
MSWTESLLCWFQPSHWRNRQALQVAKPSDANAAPEPNRDTESQHSEPDTAKPVLHDASQFTDHNVSDPGIT